jgi:polyisoprenoid-binding protein YceI
MLKRIAIMLVATATTLGAQNAKVTLASTSSIRVDGTSNVHAWHLTTSTFTSDIEMAAPAGPGSKVEAVTLTIPVTSLKSGKGGLDKNTYKAMNAEKHPTITFRLTSYMAEPKNGAYAAKIGGMLTVNGVDHAVMLDATITGEPAALQAVGTTKFKMTDFGIKPVTALMGTIRTGDEVKITFDVTGAAARNIALLPAP